MTIKELIKSFKGKTKKEIIKAVLKEKEQINNTTSNQS